MVITREQLEQDIDVLIEHVGEVQTQNMSETYLYGDSAPGSALQLASAKDDLAHLEALRARMGSHNYVFDY